MASNPYSRDSSRTWSTRSCVEQFGIYRETPVKPYNYYKNNSRFIRTGVVAVMLAIVVLLVFLMISDISKTNGAHRSREKDAFLRLLSASQENNNQTSSRKPTPSTSTPSTTPSTTTLPTSTLFAKPQDTNHANHRPTNDYPAVHFDFRDEDDAEYDWSESNAPVSPNDLADRKLHELTRLRPPNRRYDDADQDIHIHIPARPGSTPSHGPRTSSQDHRVFRTPDGCEHHEISYSDPKPVVHKNIPLHWDKSTNAAAASNSVWYHGKRRPDSLDRPIVVLDETGKGRGQKRPSGGYHGPSVTGYHGPKVTGYHSPTVKGYRGQAVPPVAGYHGQGVPAVKGYHSHGVPTVTGYHGQGVPAVTGYHGQGVPAVTGYHGEGVPAVTGYHGQGVPAVTSYHGQGAPVVMGHGVPAVSGHHGQKVPAVTDYRVFNHHAHKLGDQQKTSASDAYPQYWRPYLEDLSHGSSKKEPRVVNKNPAISNYAPKPIPKLKTKKNATRTASTLNKFPQLLNYHYPKNAKNIGDIIKFLNRFEPPQKEDPTPLFDAELGKIMKLKGVYLTHINDDPDVESNTSNGHAYNADPFQDYKPDNMADINYLLPNNLRLPTRTNQNLFKNTIRHLDEKKRNEQAINSKYFPRPPPEYTGNAPKSHQSFNSPVEAYTTAIYHPWSTSAPKTKGTTPKPQPMSVMLDVYPVDGAEGTPSRGAKRKPLKTLKMSLDKEAAASGKRQQMILHLNLYPRKKHNVVSRADVAEVDSAPNFNVNFNSDTHDIVPVRQFYNEDYEGDIRRSDDDDYADEDDDDYHERVDEKINATRLGNMDFRKGKDSNASYEKEYEREGEEVDLRINIEANDYTNDEEFEFDEITSSPTNGGSDGVSVESVSEKPPKQERTTERGETLVTMFPTKSLYRLDSLLSEKSQQFVGKSGGDSSNVGPDYGRENVLSILHSEVESDNAS